MSLSQTFYAAYFTDYSMTVEETASLVASTGQAEPCLPCGESYAQVGTSDEYIRVNEDGSETTATLAPAGEPRTFAADGPPATWQGPLGIEGELTGDGRYIQPEALEWATPLPLRIVESDVGAHQGAVVVGRILNVERLSVEDANERLVAMQAEPFDDTDAEGMYVIWGSGDYDLGSEAGREAARKNDRRLMNGVSMDLDNVAFEVRIAADAAALAPNAVSPEQLAEQVKVAQADEDGRVKVQEMAPDDEVMVTTGARMRAATQVAVPAFSRAMIFLDDPNKTQTLSAEYDVIDFGNTVINDFERRQGRETLTYRMILGGEKFEVEYPATVGSFNWVDDVGGLPKYIRRIADAIMKKGKAEGHAIAIAVNAVKKMCATGDINFPGKQDVNAGSRAEACAAVADWEAKKKRAKADSATVQTFRDEPMRAPKGKKGGGRFIPKSGGGGGEKSERKADRGRTESGEPAKGKKYQSKAAEVRDILKGMEEALEDVLDAMSAPQAKAMIKNLMNNAKAYVEGQQKARDKAEDKKDDKKDDGKSEAKDDKAETEEGKDEGKSKDDESKSGDDGTDDAKEAKEVTLTSLTRGVQTLLEKYGKDMTKKQRGELEGIVNKLQDKLQDKLSGGTATLSSLTADGWNPNEQLRVPKGNGRRSGRWMDTPGTSMNRLRETIGAFEDMHGSLPEGPDADLDDAFDAVDGLTEDGVSPKDRKFKRAVEKAINLIGKARDSLQREWNGDRDDVDNGPEVAPAREALLNDMGRAMMQMNDFNGLDLSLMDEDTDIGANDDDSMFGDLPGDDAEFDAVRATIAAGAEDPADYDRDDPMRKALLGVRSGRLDYDEAAEVALGRPRKSKPSLRDTPSSSGVGTDAEGNPAPDNIDLTRRPEFLDDGPIDGDGDGKVNEDLQRVLDGPEKMTDGMLWDVGPREAAVSNIVAAERGMTPDELYAEVTDGALPWLDASDPEARKARRKWMTFLQKQYDRLREENGLTAAAAPLDLDLPPVAHFSNPGFTGPTPLTVTADGRVSGHIAVWGTCHMTHTQRGKCITPPRSKRGYSDFMLGSTMTAEGAEIATGKITLDTRHAKDEFSAQRAMAHYDNTGLAVCDVVAGEDAYGIWVSGSLRPGVTAKDVRALRASPISGDWRRIGGNLELVAALAVNVPGFPVPRPKGLVASGAMTSLVAAGMLPPAKVQRPGTEGALSVDDLRYLKALAARGRAEEAQAEREQTLSNARRLSIRLRAQQMAAKIKA